MSFIRLELLLVQIDFFSPEVECIRMYPIRFVSLEEKVLASVGMVAAESPQPTHRKKV